VAVSPDSLVLMRADAAPLALVVRDARGRLLARGATWTSATPGIASVAANGVVTGAAPGIVQVRATVDGVADSTRVRVVPRRGTLLVTVASAETDSVIPGANVIVHPAGAGPNTPPVAAGTTGPAGQVLFTGLDEGAYDVSGSAQLFITTTVTNVVVVADQQVPLRIRLP
jgi:uncharacterized protein YjdB